MNISPLSGSTALFAGGGVSTAPVQGASRELAQAVGRLNSSSSIPENRELSLSIDPKTKIPVVRVLDATTHEVLDQLPAEYVLRVTAFLESEEAQESLSNIPSLVR